MHTTKVSGVVASHLVMAVVFGLCAGCGSSADTGEFTPGSDNDPECPETLEDFDGNATIPADADCSYANLVTGGNLVVEQGANLTLEGGEVAGSVQASAWSQVIVIDSAIHGSFQVEGGPSLEIERSTIDGNLQIAGITGPVSISVVDVGGALQISSCSDGTIEMIDTTIAGNLDCTDNSSSFELENVTVSGASTGQCEE